MSPVQIKKRFPAGLLLFALGLSIYKAVMLNAGLEGDWWSYLILLTQDGFYLAVLLVFGVVKGGVTSSWAGRFLWLALFLLVVVYMVDSFTLLALNEHAPLFDMARYALEPGVLLSFLDKSVTIAFGLLVISAFFNVPFQGLARGASALMLLVVMTSAAYSASNVHITLARYTMLSPQGLLELFKSGQPVLAYSDAQVNFYSSQAKQETFVPVSKPDIILLVVESLSSINSKRVSGINGFLNGFDELSSKGLLFQNFFANHQASEGGLISLLSGYPPIHYPTASPYMFDEFSIQHAVITEYQEAGYVVDFLTNAQLDFIGLNHYLDGIGVDRSRGRDEAQSMKDAPVIVQGAPSDELLYEEAIRTVAQYSHQTNPFLLCIATTSTHLPYKHPGDGPDTAEAVWAWSMLQLTAFYQRLSERGYFDHGILLITGDHRQMRPLTEAETRRYGDSARARVPLLVIGRNYEAGQLDERFYQQSDLLRMLGKISRADEPLSPHPVWVERYNRKYGRIELIDSLSVFDEAGAGYHEYRLKIPGNRIEWAGEKPGFARSIETRIHAQRSLHQQTRTNSKEP